MTSTLVIHAAITISSPHRLQTRGSTSKTFFSIRAHDERRRASAEPGVADGGASGGGTRSASASTSSFCVGPSPPNVALASRRNLRFLQE
jgi:hypothetical protein